MAEPIAGGIDFAYLSAADWSGAWHMPQEVAARFGAAGNRVLYVESLGWRRPRAFDLPRIAGRARRALHHRGERPDIAPGVRLLSPTVIPGVVSSRTGRRVNRWLLSNRMSAAMGRPDAARVLWIYTPSRLALDMIGCLDEDLVVYHCIQSHRHRPHAPPETAALERELIARADAVIVDAIELYRERAPLHPFVYRVPGGVEPDDYDGLAAPEWTAGLPRPILGYLGTVDHRIDPSSLARLARSRPDATVLVVGPVVDADVSVLRAIGNVVMHPGVPIAEVPSVLSAFDVGLMPYAQIPMTRYTYPAKLHQYLAAGLPVAAEPLPDLEEFGGLIDIAEGGDLTGAVARALARPPDVAARRAVAARNTWARRIGEMSAIVAGHLLGDPPPGSGDAAV